MKKIAFIGGTGAENSVLLKDVTEHIIETPYGEAKYEAGFFEGREIIHLSRHGAHHTIPPHKINYRANMFALKMLDVAAVISTTAVGSLNPDYKPGELVLLDQFIDMTKAREGTFYDGERYGVAHLDMSHPYCASLRKAILAAGDLLRKHFHGHEFRRRHHQRGTEPSGSLGLHGRKQPQHVPHRDRRLRDV